MTYSFDIFDTCLVRKCGTPENMLDVLSLRVFKEPVEEWVRQEFVVARKAAEDRVWKENTSGKLCDIYEAMRFSHPALFPLAELEKIEIELEKSLLVPVLRMRDRIDTLRTKGHHIIYISDMYLPGTVIREKMNEYGFLKDLDGLYISCEVGKQKQDGSLFRYVQEKECLNVRRWRHTGDNKLSDRSIPESLGIKAELVKFGYNPYPYEWRSNDYSLGFKYPSVLAGLSRALSLSNDDNTHRDFVTDIIAPFYCTFLFQILEDADNRKIKRLYFCSRDASQLYKIALKMQHIFPDIEMKYLNISREALYKESNDISKLAYFEQIGLATETDDVAIVDITTSGKTIFYLNRFLRSKGYRELKCYYYLLWNEVDGTDRSRMNCQIYDAYIKQNRKCDVLRSPSNAFIVENFFAMNNEPKTVDYQEGQPVFSDETGIEDGWMGDGDKWGAIHQALLEQYAESYVEFGLGKWSKECFQQVVIPTMARLLSSPARYYLKAVQNYFFRRADGLLLPMFKRHSFYSLFIHRKRDYVWRSATLAISLPDWILALKDKISNSLR